MAPFERVEHAKPEQGFKHPQETQVKRHEKKQLRHRREVVDREEGPRPDPHPVKEQPKHQPCQPVPWPDIADPRAI